MAVRQLSIEASEDVKRMCLDSAERATNSELNRRVLELTRSMLAQMQIDEQELIDSDSSTLRRFNRTSGEPGVFDDGDERPKINKDSVRTMYAYIFKRIGMFHLFTDGMALLGEDIDTLVPRQAKDIANTKDHRKRQHLRVRSVIGGFFVLDPNSCFGQMSVTRLESLVPSWLVSKMDGLIGAANKKTRSKESADVKKRRVQITKIIEADKALESKEIADRLPASNIVNLTFSAMRCSVVPNDEGLVDLDVSISSDAARQLAMQILENV